jgi:DNA-binding transcriptional LysR family regulator
MISSLEAGLLKVGVDPTLGNTVLAPALITVLKSLPKFRWSIISSHRLHLMELLDAIAAAALPGCKIT